MASLELEPPVNEECTPTDPDTNAAKRELYKALPVPLLRGSVEARETLDGSVEQIERDANTRRFIFLTCHDSEEAMIDEFVRLEKIMPTPDYLEAFQMLAAIPGRMELRLAQRLRPQPERFREFTENHSLELHGSRTKIERAYNNSHADQPVHNNIGKQEAAGMDTMMVVYGLLVADVYRQLIELGVDPSKRPSIANTLIKSKAMIATSLILALNNNLSHHMDRIDGNTSSPSTDNRNLMRQTNEIRPDRSPISVIYSDDGIKISPNHDVIKLYWSDDEGQDIYNDTLGCPASRAVNIDGRKPESAIQHHAETLATVLIGSNAFEHYEEYMQATVSAA